MVEFGEDEDEGPGFKDKDEHLENMREMRKELRLSLGFRIRVSREELTRHLLDRVAYHRGELARMLKNAQSETRLDRRTAEFSQLSKAVFFHKSTAEAYAFYAAHLAQPFFDLPPEDCLKLELCAPSAHETELFPGFEFEESGPFGRFVEP